MEEIINWLPSLLSFLNKEVIGWLYCLPSLFYMQVICWLNYMSSSFTGWRLVGYATVLITLCLQGVHCHTLFRSPDLLGDCWWIILLTVQILQECY